MTKTLDEIIDDFEKACDLERRCEGCSGCLGQEAGCPNDGAASVPDALHYLKEYKKYNDTMCALPDYYEWVHSADNPPLTWSELKQMFHRPVWIETTAKKGWNIIVSIDSTDIQVIHTAHRGPKQSVFRKADLGKTWQAYRKERE